MADLVTQEQVTGYPLITATIGHVIFIYHSFAGIIGVGDWIEAGQLVGYAGLSGTTSTASHLHYDETSPQNLPVNRIFFGPFVACHGNTMVQYPDILGTSDWQQVPYGTVIRNDGYECLGGVQTRIPTQPTD